MWNRRLAIAGLVAALLLSATACTAQRTAKTVTYHVTGALAVGAVKFEYIDATGQ